MLYTGTTFITSDKILTNLAWFTEHVNSLPAKLLLQPWESVFTLCAALKAIDLYEIKLCLWL